MPYNRMQETMASMKRATLCLSTSCLSTLRRKVNTVNQKMSFEN